MIFDDRHTAFLRPPLLSCYEGQLSNTLDQSRRADWLFRETPYFALIFSGLFANS